MAKYDPLYDFLVNMHTSVENFTLTFQQIDRILATKLPTSAYSHRAWWANEVEGSHVEAQAWMEAGWKVEAVNQEDNWVRFRRSS